ncbi:MAG: GntR family transcriptional regulator [Alphaproteobacteria bacterium]
MASSNDQSTAWHTLARPSPLRERVYEALRAELRAGRFARGERLREEDIARQLGVSRTPVREALVQLYRDGLLSEAGRGFMLADLTATDIAEILELRLLLEPAAARHAAEHAPPEEVARLRHCLSREQATAHLPDAAAFIAANADFRLAFVDMCGNARLIRSIRLYDDQIDSIRRLTLAPIPNRRFTVSLHEKLLSAIEARNADAAEQAMRALIKGIGDYTQASP